MIHVIATITLHPGKREAFLVEFRKLVPLVLQELGCMAYGPTIDAVTTVAAQGARRPDTVVVVEQWNDLPALMAHLVAPHMGPYRAAVKELIANVSLQILEPA